MKFFEKIKRLVSSNEVKEASTDLLEDVGNTLLGNPVSGAKVLISVLKSPEFIQQQIFWAKLQALLEGLDLDEDEMLQMSAALAKDGNKDDNVVRLVSYIDRAESLRKVDCFVNVTRCLLAGYIDLELYFRICQAVTNTQLEDLMYLRGHISEQDLRYNRNVQGLITTGLMATSIVGADQRYSFTPLADDVDRFAVSFKDVDRYPDPTSKTKERKTSLKLPPQLWGEMKDGSLDFSGAAKDVASIK